MTSLNPNLAAAPVKGVTVVDPAQSFFNSSANSSGGIEKVSRPWIKVIVFRPARILGVSRIGDKVPFLSCQSLGLRKPGERGNEEK
jgi:hypothetical protein